MNTEKMTRGERQDLTHVVKMRAKIAREDISQYAAQQLAQVEAQLAARYDMQDLAWAEITREAEQKIEQLDAELAKRCRQRGIPEQFRPTLELGWYSRGENASNHRRAELRKVAATEIDARVKAAKAKVFRAEAELLEKICAEGLTSTAAKEFLAAMPTIDQLMPKLMLGDLEKQVPLIERL